MFFSLYLAKNEFATLAVFWQPSTEVTFPEGFPNAITEVANPKEVPSSKELEGLK